VFNAVKNHDIRPGCYDRFGTSMVHVEHVLAASAIDIPLGLRAWEYLCKAVGPQFFKKLNWFKLKNKKRLFLGQPGPWLEYSQMNRGGSRAHDYFNTEILPLLIRNCSDDSIPQIAYNILGSSYVEERSEINVCTSSVLDGGVKVKMDLDELFMKEESVIAPTFPLLRQTTSDGDYTISRSSCKWES